MNAPILESAIVETMIPAASGLQSELAGAYFHDCWQTTVAPHQRTAMELYLDTVRQTPGWVNFLMSLRNRVVGLVGLKNLGSLAGMRADKAAADYRPGDRAGIFRVLRVSDDEVILGDDDRHLRVQVSVCKLRHDGRDAVAVSTVVHLHGLLGRIYMIPVAPMHKLIVPAVLRRLRKPA